MTYSYETTKFTVYLVILVLALAIGAVIFTRGLVGVLWVKHGEAVKSSLLVVSGAVLCGLSILSANVFSINNFDVEEFQKMLEPTGYLVGKGLPSSYNDPIPVETVTGEKCYFQGHLQSLLPTQVFTFAPEGCGENKAK